jgi:hypothetical protein
MTRRVIVEKCEWYLPGEWPDPTPRMLKDPAFNAIWEAIKQWDIRVPECNDGFGTTGNHARAIFDALRHSGCL